MKTTDIKILGIIDEDPFHYKTWSGISRYFWGAFKKNGSLFDVIDAQPSRLTTYLYKLLNLQRGMDKWRFKYNLDIRYYNKRTQSALKKIDKLSDNDYNTILQIGAWYDLTKRKDKLTVSYHDGNLSAVLKSPYGYPWISESFINKTLKYEKCLYDKMDLIFPMSRWLADSFIKDFNVDHEKIFPVGAGINLSLTDEIKDKDYETPRILFIGKDFERKGGKYLLEAFKIVKKEIKEVKLTIIGPRIKDLPDGVNCLNFVSKDTEEGMNALLKEYSASSIFVMPSLYEPFGIVFCEAMAHKLPCIGTNICAMPEIIDDGKTGYIVPTRDTMSLARRMLDLLKSPELCREMGENGYKRYRENYTWDIVTKKIVERIEEQYY